MKIFWLCNVELPIISEARGETLGVFGGWLDQTSRSLAEDNELTVCYMSYSDISGVVGNIRYYGFIEERSDSFFSTVLKDCKYDVYHIWGTEYKHSYHCIKLLKEIDQLNKTVVSIQGLVSVCKRYYLSGIASDAVKKRFRTGLFSSAGIIDGYKDFDNKSKYEISTLKTTKNVIGRTYWDQKCVYAINSDVRYYKCNENLRQCFYDGEWDIDRIDRHTIFVSQCSYPIKGMHYIINALPIILNKFPDARIVTTGPDIVELSRKGRLGSDPYARYLVQIIEENKIADNIVFRGYLSAEDMKEQYLKANLFLSASTIENSPNSVGEAMILGCPVVSSYVGGVMDMIDHGIEGLLFQSGSIETMAGYIMDIFSDDSLAASLSKNARIRAAKTHDIRENNGKLLNIYREL